MGTLACENGNLESLPDGPKDTDKAQELMLEAAQGLHKAAQYAMASIHHEKGDEDESLHWIKMAAHNGHAEAQKTYACQYWLMGCNGHEKDEEQADVWLRRALQHNDEGVTDAVKLAADCGIVPAINMICESM